MVTSYSYNKHINPLYSSGKWMERSFGPIGVGPRPHFHASLSLELFGADLSLMTGKISGLGVDSFEKVQIAWIDAAKSVGRDLPV